MLFLDQADKRLPESFGEEQTTADLRTFQSSAQKSPDTPGSPEGMPRAGHGAGRRFLT